MSTIAAGQDFQQVVAQSFLALLAFLLPDLLFAFFVQGFTLAAVAVAVAVGVVVAVVVVAAAAQGFTVTVAVAAAAAAVLPFPALALEFCAAVWLAASHCSAYHVSALL